MIKLTPLTNAIERLKEGSAAQASDPQNALLRDGLIQRFEFTYELSHKMLKRFLATTSANPAEFDDVSFADLIRSGNQRGLLRSDWPVWRTYRDMRAKTSHTYDEVVAVEVVAGIPAFLEEAEHLLARLEERQG